MVTRELPQRTRRTRRFNPEGTGLFLLSSASFYVAGRCQAPKIACHEIVSTPTHLLRRRPRGLRFGLTLRWLKASKRRLAGHNRCTPCPGARGPGAPKAPRAARAALEAVSPGMAPHVGVSRHALVRPTDAFLTPHAGPVCAPGCKTQYSPSIRARAIRRGSPRLFASIPDTNCGSTFSVTVTCGDPTRYRACRARETRPSVRQAATGLSESRPLARRLS